MNLIRSVDLDAVLQEVLPALESPQRQQSPGRRRVDGRMRGHPVTVSIWSRSGGGGWEVKAELGALPLLLRIARKGVGDQGLIDDGVISALRTGDASFDATWVIEAAPKEMAQRIVDATFPGRMQALAQQLDPPYVLPVFRMLLVPPVSLDKGRLSITCQGRFDAKAVIAALELAAHMLDRIAAIRAEREATPPSAAQLAREEALVAQVYEKDKTLWRRAPWPIKLLIVLLALMAVAGTVQSVVETLR